MAVLFEIPYHLGAVRSLGAVGRRQMDFNRGLAQTLHRSVQVGTEKLPYDARTSLAALSALAEHWQLWSSTSEAVTATLWRDAASAPPGAHHPFPTDEQFPTRQSPDYYAGVHRGLSLHGRAAQCVGNLEVAKKAASLAGAVAVSWHDSDRFYLQAQLDHLSSTATALGQRPPAASQELRVRLRPGLFSLRNRLTLYLGDVYAEALVERHLRPHAGETLGLSELAKLLDQAREKELLERAVPLNEPILIRQDAYSAFGILGCVLGSERSVELFHQLCGVTEAKLDASVSDSKIEALTQDLIGETSKPKTRADALATVYALAPRGQRILPAVFKAVSKGGPGTGSAIPALVARFGPLAVPHLIPMLKAGGGAADLALSTLSALGPLARDLVPTLVGQLRPDDEPLRQLRWLRGIAASAPDMLSQVPDAARRLTALVELRPPYPAPDDANPPARPPLVDEVADLAAALLQTAAAA